VTGSSERHLFFVSLVLSAGVSKVDIVALNGIL
jgi:hypothetical protein